MPDIEFLFHPDAEREFVSAFQWYWDRNSQAANAFDGAVMAGIAFVRRNPSVWPIYLHGTQKYAVQKFPIRGCHKAFRNCPISLIRSKFPSPHNIYVAF